VRKTKPLPIECVARGYISGSGWIGIPRHGKDLRHRAPAGPLRIEPAAVPIFTPATKAEEGHDENISYEKAAEIAGKEMTASARDATLKIYGRAAEYALGRGIIIADTKMEFGTLDGRWS